VPLDDLHVERDRAESFGSQAEEYDRRRAGYPDALIDDLVALGPTTVLDVGCGTGKVAVSLIARGLNVLGVEPDERMAAVARRNGVPVETASFETWDAAGRTFDLVTCGHAWHWIDPALGVRKAAQLVRPGGTISRFWSYHVLDAPVIAAFDAVYRELAPGVASLGHDPSGTDDGPDPFAAGDAFTRLEPRTYRWERTFDADGWTGLVATFSDHQRLGRERLAALQRALSTVIADLGGVVRAQCGTYVLCARRN
jgi:SAM-dependent methyltransferase